jgi:hypothetical protein
MPWYRDGQARWLILRYAAWLGVLNLVWETAHVPLYTIWTEGTPAYIAFAVVHCTAADILVGSAALALVLIFGRERELAQWHWRRIAAGTVLIGVVFTAFSEWLNTIVLRSWAYSERMPVLELAGVEIGASPLAQWVVLPPLALYLARTVREPRRDRAVP